MLLTDLSKAFNRLKHNLLIAKLAAYGSDEPSISFIFSYLSDWIQRTEVRYTYNYYTYIKYGIPQCSILDLHRFNIDVCDLFFWDYKCDIASYADDNTPYTSDISLNLILEKFESSTHDFFGWFKEKHTKANPNKCHFLVTTNALINLRKYKLLLNNKRQRGKTTRY